MNGQRPPKRRYAIIGIVLLFGACWFLTAVPRDYVLDKYCQPRGLFNGVRANLRPISFWHAQATAVDRSIEGIERMPVVRAQLTAKMDSMNASWREKMDSIYRAHQTIKPPVSNTLAAELRETADAIEPEARNRMIDSLMGIKYIELLACQAQLADRAKDWSK